MAVSGKASAGAAMGKVSVPSSCCSVACSTRTGTAGETICVSFKRSVDRCGDGMPPCSSAAASQAMLNASAGTLIGQASSFAAPAASTTSCAGSASGVRVMSLPLPEFATPCKLACTFISRAVVLRRVSIALKRSPSRTSGGRPDKICKSWVTRMLVLPVPNCCVPASAMATSLKRVSESFSGTSTTASPFASSSTFAFHTSSVSNSSRVLPRPPPPPAASALRPWWRRPMISLCAVLVSTPQARG